MDKEFLLSYLELENELSEHQRFVPQCSAAVHAHGWTNPSHQYISDYIHEKKQYDSDLRNMGQ